MGPGATMNLVQVLARVRADGFVRSVSVLVGGTALAHGITALSLPLVTRLYTPSDFSVLAVFTGLFAILSVAACLRFDVAIPIPEDDGDAANVLGLALISSAVVSAAVAFGVLIAPDILAGWLNQPALQRYLWLLPPAVMLAGSYSALQFWFVRRKAFGSIARTRIAQSCAGAGTQIGFGLLGWAPLGLVLGQALNSGAGAIGLGYRLAATESGRLGTISWARMRAMFSAYDRFPKLSTFEALSNSAGMQLPIIMVAALAAGPEAGYLVLAAYVMQAPMGLLGTAISQVYFSRAPDEHRAGRLGAFTARVFGGLMKGGVGPLVFAGIVAPTVFGIIFGQDWARAGVLVSWMTPWFVMQFLSVPVSSALLVTDNQKAALALQVSGLILRVAAVYLASFLTPDFIAEAYAVSGFVFYLVYVGIVLRVVSARTADISSAVRSGLPAILMWSSGGGAVVLLAKAVT